MGILLQGFTEKGVFFIIIILFIFLRWNEVKQHVRDVRLMTKNENENAIYIQYIYVRLYDVKIISTYITMNISNRSSRVYLQSKRRYCVICTLKLCGADRDAEKWLDADKLYSRTVTIFLRRTIRRAKPTLHFLFCFLNPLGWGVIARARYCSKRLPSIYVTFLVVTHEKIEKPLFYYFKICKSASWVQRVKLWPYLRGAEESRWRELSCSANFLLRGNKKKNMLLPPLEGFV